MLDPLRQRGDFRFIPCKYKYGILRAMGVLIRSSTDHIITTNNYTPLTILYLCCSCYIIISAESKITKSGNQQFLKFDLRLFAL